MAVSIVETAGSASANSYVSQSEATTYLEGRLNSSAWTDASSDSKNRALVEAARELNVVSWKATRTDDTQALAWPRYMVVDPDAPVSGTYYFSSTEIPQRVKDAQCELALEFLKAGTTDIAALPSTDGVIQKQVDVLSTTYAEPSQRRSGLSRYPRVMALIAPLLTSTPGSVRLVRS